MVLQLLVVMPPLYRVKLPFTTTPRPDCEFAYSCLTLPIVRVSPPLLSSVWQSVRVKLLFAGTSITAISFTELV